MRVFYAFSTRLLEWNMSYSVWGWKKVFHWKGKKKRRKTIFVTSVRVANLGPFCPDMDQGSCDYRSPPETGGVWNNLSPYRFFTEPITESRTGIRSNYRLLAKALYLRIFAVFDMDKLIVRELWGVYILNLYRNTYATCKIDSMTIVC